MCAFYGVAAKCYEVYKYADVLTQGRVLRVLSKESLSSHVFSKFPAFDGARRFITLFVQADEADTTTLYFIKFHCDILPPTHESSKIPFFCSYPTISPMRSTFIASLILILSDSANDVRWSVLGKSSLHTFLPLPYVQIILITYPFSNILNLRSFPFQVSQPYKSAVLPIFFVIAMEQLQQLSNARSMPAWAENWKKPLNRLRHGRQSSEAPARNYCWDYSYTVIFLFCLDLQTNKIVHGTSFAFESP